MTSPRKHRLRIAIATSLAILACPLMLTAQDNIDPSLPILWRLKKGDEFTVTLTQNSTSKVSLDKRSNRVNSITKLRMNWVVKSDAEEAMQIEQSIEAIATEIIDPKVPEQKIAFDTDSSERIERKSREMMEQVKPLTGVKFMVTMSSRGEILEVTIPDASQKIIDQLPNALRIKALFDKRGLKEILGYSTTVFPESGTDQQWSYDDTIDTEHGKFKRIVDCNIVKPIETIATIKTKMTVESSESKIQGFKLLSLGGTGTIEFDRKQGRIRQSKLTFAAVSEIPLREKSIRTDMEETIEMKMEPKKQ